MSYLFDAQDAPIGRIRTLLAMLWINWQRVKRGADVIRKLPADTHEYPRSETCPIAKALGVRVGPERWYPDSADSRGKRLPKSVVELIHDIDRRGRNAA